MINDIAQVVIALSAVAALVMTVYNSRRIKDVHISINSRMDQLLTMTGIAKKAEGAEEERNRKNGGG